MRQNGRAGRVTRWHWLLVIGLGFGWVPAAFGGPLVWPRANAAPATADHHDDEVQTPMHRRDAAAPPYAVRLKITASLARQHAREGNVKRALVEFHSILNVDDPAWAGNPDAESLRIARDLEVAQLMAETGFYDHSIRVLETTLVQAQVNSDPQASVVERQIKATSELARVKGMVLARAEPDPVKPVRMAEQRNQAEPARPTRTPAPDAVKSADTPSRASRMVSSSPSRGVAPPQPQGQVSSTYADHPFSARTNPPIVTPDISASYCAECAAHAASGFQHAIVTSDAGGSSSEWTAWIAGSTSARASGDDHSSMWRRLGRLKPSTGKRRAESIVRVERGSQRSDAPRLTPVPVTSTMMGSAQPVDSATSSSFPPIVIVDIPEGADSSKPVLEAEPAAEPTAAPHVAAMAEVAPAAPANPVTTIAGSVSEDSESESVLPSDEGRGPDLDWASRVSPPVPPRDVRDESKQPELLQEHAHAAEPQPKTAGPECEKHREQDRSMKDRRMLLDFSVRDLPVSRLDLEEPSNELGARRADVKAGDTSSLPTEDGVSQTRVQTPEAPRAAETTQAKPAAEPAGLLPGASSRERVALADHEVKPDPAEVAAPNLFAQDVAGPESLGGEKTQQRPAAPIRRQVAVAGAVARPGIYAMDEASIPLGDVLRGAGGTKSASAKRARIVRLVDLGVDAFGDPQKDFYCQGVKLADVSKGPPIPIYVHEVVIVEGTAEKPIYICVMPHFVLELPVNPDRPVNPAEILERIAESWPEVWELEIGVVRNDTWGRATKLAKVPDIDGNASKPFAPGDILYVHGPGLDRLQVLAAADAIADVVGARVRMPEPEPIEKPSSDK